MGAGRRPRLTGAGRCLSTKSKACSLCPHTSYNSQPYSAALKKVSPAARVRNPTLQEICARAKASSFRCTPSRACQSSVSARLNGDACSPAAHSHTHTHGKYFGTALAHRSPSCAHARKMEQATKRPAALVCAAASSPAAVGFRTPRARQHGGGHDEAAPLPKRPSILTELRRCDRAFKRSLATGTAAGLSAARQQRCGNAAAATDRSGGCSWP